MTVEATTSRVKYATNGTTGPFTVNFYFLADADLEVVYTDANGAETILTLTTDYIVTGAGDPAGGNVTTVTAYASGGTITILRSIDPLQETDYTETDPFPAASHERALDKVTMLIQQLKEVTARALVFSPSDDLGSQLPAAAARASKLIGFDSLGRVSMSAPTSGSAADLALSLAGSATIAEGAGAIGYDRSLSYPSGTVGAKLNGFTLATEFAGVDPTGVDDSTTGLQNFLNLGGNLRIPAGTYTISGGGLLGVANTHLVLDPGVVIDFSAVRAPAPNSPWSNTGFAIGWKGSIGSAVLLTSNAAADQNAVVVADVTGLAADDWINISSNAYYETDTNTKCGELAQILAVDGGTKTITLTQPLYLTYNTANSAAIRKMSFCENVTVEGEGELRGGYAGARYHGGIEFRYCRNFKVKGITTNKTDYVGFQAYKCADGLFDGVTCKKDSYTGGNIGVDVEYGSRNISVVNSTFYDFCHAVDVGGDTAIGGISMGVKAINNQAFNMHGAAFNTHPGAGKHIDFSHNTVHMSVGLTYATPTGMCGIRCQGPQLTAIGNALHNITGHGIFHQIETAQTVKKSSTILGNQIVASITNSADFAGNRAILVQGYAGSGATTLDTATISNNFATGFETGVSVYANEMNITAVVIHGNHLRYGTASTAARSITVRAATGYTVGNFAITGNVCDMPAATGQGIYILGDDADSVLNGTILANTITGSQYAMRFDQAKNVSVNGNTAIGYGTSRYYDGGAAASTNLMLDRTHTAAKTNSSATYTVTINDSDIISSVAGNSTYTLPAAASNPGRIIDIRTTTANTVVSASSNVIPLAGGAAGTAILAATAGKYARLKSDGTNWQIMQAS